MTRIPILQGATIHRITAVAVNANNTQNRPTTMSRSASLDSPCGPVIINLFCHWFPPSASRKAPQQTWGYYAKPTLGLEQELFERDNQPFILRNLLFETNHLYL